MRNFGKILCLLMGMVLYGCYSNLNPSPDSNASPSTEQVVMDYSWDGNYGFNSLAGRSLTPFYSYRLDNGFLSPDLDHDKHWRTPETKFLLTSAYPTSDWWINRDGSVTVKQTDSYGNEWYSSNPTKDK